VKESNGDVASGLPRPLAPETTSGRNLKNHKTLKNSQTVADRRVKREDTKEPSSVGLSNSETISGEWRRLLPISATGLFCQNEKALINAIVNGASSKRKLYRIPIANRGRPYGWSSYFRHAEPPRGGFRFRSVVKTSKSAIKSRTVAAGGKMSAEHQ
jgi:hypothetical protein